MKYFGAHVSASGGLENAVKNAKEIGATYMINDEGVEETDVIANDTKPLNAPVRIVFNANLSEPCNVKYTWTITNTKEATSEPIIRRRCFSKKY